MIGTVLLDQKGVLLLKFVCGHNYKLWLLRTRIVKTQSMVESRYTTFEYE